METMTEQPQPAPTTTVPQKPEPPKQASHAIASKPPPAPGINLAPKRPRQIPLLWMAVITGVILILSIAVYLFPKDTIEIGDQAVGEVIHFRKLHLTSPAALVVKRVSIEDGVVAIALTQLLMPETYQEFDVPVIKDQLPLKAGERLYATLYTDSDSNGEVNPLADEPKRNMFGFPTRMYFSVR